MVMDSLFAHSQAQPAIARKRRSGTSGAGSYPVCSGIGRGKSHRENSNVSGTAHVPLTCRSRAAHVPLTLPLTLPSQEALQAAFLGWGAVLGRPVKKRRFWGFLTAIEE